MVSRLFAGAALAGVLVAATPALADDDDNPPSAGDVLFYIGQVTGSAPLCKVAIADVNALVARAFQALDLSPDQGSDGYKRFAEGVTDGGKRVNSGKSKCSDVIAAFNALQDKFK